MKSAAYQTLVFFLFIALVSSCTVEKKLYSNGYYFSWNHRTKTTQEQKNTSQCEEQKEIPVSVVSDDDLTLVDNSTVADKGETSIILSKRFFDSIPKKEICDTILLKNGIKVLGTITEVSNDLIKYKACENLEGPPHSVNKLEVLRIKYANGKEEIISKKENDDIYSSATTSRSKTISSTDRLDNKSRKIAGACLLAMLLAIMGLLILGLPLGIAAIALGIFGIVKVSGNKKEYKGIGLGVLGIILGILDIIGVLIYLNKKK